MPRVFSVFVLLFGPALAWAAGNHLFAHQPTLNRTQIVFVYAGDLWSVPREGGAAKRLTTGPGSESNPVFSPDGTQIAFTGEYDGNVDVFVIPAAGGVPKRLTWHPAADNALGWTPDGKRVLFTSQRTAYSRFAELFTAGLDGGLEEKLPLPRGAEAAMSPDGARLAYVPFWRASGVWKRYRGGRTTPIWIASLADSSIEKVPRDNSNDFNPMWYGGHVYFLSDRNGPTTLFVYDPRTKQVRPVLNNDGFDLKAASAGPDAIVYEQFGGIFLLDPKSGKSKQVPITVAGDMPDVRERFVNIGRRIRNANISPTGARAVFEARGEIFTVPAEKGDPRILTNTSGVMESYPAWSPDGKTIAYFSDESGEYELHLRPQNGVGDVTKIKLSERPIFYAEPRWSPDSKKIAYADNQLGMWYIDLTEKKPVKIDKHTYLSSPEAPVWSPDSKWMAYSKRLKNYLNAVFLYSVADGKSTQLTDGMSDARHPVFDKDGKYLYFTASTDAGATFEQDIHAMARTETRSVYLAVLAKDQASPFAPESDEEKPAAGEKKAEEPKPAGPAKAGDAKPKAPEKPINVDLEGIDQRILAMPLPPRRYIGLQAGKAGTLLALEAPRPAPGTPGGLAVHRFDVAKRKADVAISGVRNFEIAHNGEKMLFQRGENWFIGTLKPMAAGPGAPPTPPPPAAAPGGGDTPLKTANIEVRVNPREEWNQMYREVWRIERDFFYDPNLHGLDLASAQKKYAPYLEYINSRSDLNYLFAEMLGEMTVGHLGVGGGDSPVEVKRVQTGLLGADYKIENGRYRFERVYSGENWNPDLKAPLTQPGVNVKAGEYLLAVNGRELRASDNVFSFFEGTADRSVVIKVGPDPGGKDAREMTVVPIANESRLRNLAWIDENRRKVERMTHGRVAYIYMPDTAFGGLNAFNRYFFAQVGKEAAIIDERFNGGGMLATDIVEYLNRKLMSKVATRAGEDEAQPQGAIFGPKVMLINETAGSGGDAMPWYFRRAGTGKLIGTRTWGGLVGRAGAPELMDGGFASAPGSGVYNPITGEWEVENIGVAPDIEVEYDPALVRKGQDPQLERAVKEIMAALEKQPPQKLRRPEYPNYHKGRSAN